jgi:hypothetical protein
MVDSIRKVDYYSMTIPNKPGEAFKVLSALVSGGVNLLACTACARGHRAQIDVVPDDKRRFNAAAKKAGLKFDAKKTGFMVQGDDRAGAVAEHLKRLSDAGINVTAVDAITVGEGRFGAILWVDMASLTRAARVLRMH